MARLTARDLDRLQAFLSEDVMGIIPSELREAGLILSLDRTRSALSFAYTLTKSRGLGHATLLAGQTRAGLVEIYAGPKMIDPRDPIRLHTAFANTLRIRCDHFLKHHNLNRVVAGLPAEVHAECRSDGRVFYTFRADLTSLAQVEELAQTLRKSLTRTQRNTKPQKGVESFWKRL